MDALRCALLALCNKQLTTLKYLELPYSAPIGAVLVRDKFNPVVRSRNHKLRFRNWSQRELIRFLR